MKLKGFTNNLNIGFSFGLMVVMALLIIKGLFAEHKMTSGYLESFECVKNHKDESTYQYNLKLQSEEVFRNLIEVPCDSILKISPGDFVEVESVGHIFTQIKMNDVEVFDKKYLESRGHTVNFVFVLLFIFGLFDVCFRVYIKVKSRGGTSI